MTPPDGGGDGKDGEGTAAAAASSPVTTSFASDLLLSLPPGGEDRQQLDESVAALLQVEQAAAVTEPRDVRSCLRKKTEQGHDDAVGKAARGKGKAGADADDAKELLAKAVDERLSGFLESMYGSKPNVSAPRHAVEIVRRTEEGGAGKDGDGDDDVVLLVRTYAELVDGPNRLSGFCAGEWVCEPVSEQSLFVSGRLTIQAASEEKANCHFRLERTSPRRVVETAEEKVNAIVARMEARRMSYEEKVAKKLVDHLKTSCYEAAYDDVRNRTYAELDENLKQVRRILPVTKTRFKWDVAAQKQVTLLNARKDERQTKRKD